MVHEKGPPEGEHLSMEAGAPAALRFDFHGFEFTVLTYRGRPALIARELGEALGYDDRGGRLPKLITHEWSAKFEAGEDYDIVANGNLADLREILGAGSSDEPAKISPKARSLMLLYESGVDTVLVRTDKPEGWELQRYLIKNVLPKLRRGQAIVPAGRQLPDPAPAALPAPPSAELELARERRLEAQAKAQARAAEAESRAREAEAQSRADIEKTKARQEGTALREVRKAAELALTADVRRSDVARWLAGTMEIIIGTSATPVPAPTWPAQPSQPEPQSGDAPTPAPIPTGAPDAKSEAERILEERRAHETERKRRQRERLREAEEERQERFLAAVRARCEQIREQSSSSEPEPPPPPPPPPAPTSVPEPEQWLSTREVCTKLGVPGRNALKELVASVPAFAKSGEVPGLRRLGISEFGGDRKTTWEYSPQAVALLADAWSRKGGRR